MTTTLSRLFLLLLIVIVFQVQESVAAINIGGLFPLSETIAPEEKNRVTAGRIAVEEINNRTDLLPDVRLNWFPLNTKTTKAGGFDATLHLIQEKNVSGLVGAGYSSVSFVVATVAQVFNITTISYSSTNPTLSDKTSYPTFLRTVPSDSHQGLAITELIRHFEWSRFAMLVARSEYGTGMANEIAENAKNLTIIESLSFLNTEELQANLDRIKESGALVVIAIANSNDTANIFREASRKNMTGPESGLTWIVTDGGTKKLWINDTYQDDELLQAMQGAIGTRPHRAHGDTYEKEFKEKWESLDCNEYDGAGCELNIFAPYTYDAVYAYARAWDKWLKQPGNSEANIPTGTALVPLLLNVSFEGLTGNVSFNENGDRAELLYEFANLQNKEWKKIGSWRGGESPILSINNTIIVWPDNTTDVPRDAPLASTEYLNKTAAIIAIACGALGFLVCVIFFSLVIVYWKQPAIKESTALFNCIIIASISVIYIACILFSLDFSSMAKNSENARKVICSLLPWLLGVPYITAFACLFAKTWRVHKIFRNTKLKVEILSNAELLKYVSVLVAIEIVLLIAWSAGWRLNSSLIPLKEKAAEINACRSDKSTVFLLLLGGYKVILLIMCLVLCFQIRKVDERYNESKWISFSIYNITFVAIIVAVVSLIVHDYRASKLIQIYGIVIANTCTLLLLYVPKFYRIYKEAALPNRQHESSKTVASQKNKKRSISRSHVAHIETKSKQQEDSYISKLSHDDFVEDSAASISELTDDGSESDITMSLANP